MFVEVKKAVHLNDYVLYIEFTDGVTKIVDLKGELNGTIFEPLKDISVFKSFFIKYNTIEWPNGADFAPEYLYQIGKTSSHTQ